MQSQPENDPHTLFKSVFLFSDCCQSRWSSPKLLITSFFLLNYLLKMFVIHFMDREAMDLYVSYQGLNNTGLKQWVFRNSLI